MVFRITSTNNRRQAGFTLVETLVASLIASLLAVGLASLVFYTGRSFAAMGNYVELDYQSRQALDTMTREIRQANRLLEFSPSRLVFEDSDLKRLTYDFDKSNETLKRYKEGGDPPEKLLLKECRDLIFSIYQRNPITGTYDQYEAATPATCKLVQIHWVCSRKTLGTIVNTESVQSAKVVIRKQ